MKYLHKVESKVKNYYDFDKNCHLTHVYNLSDRSDPQGYVVIYDRLGSKDSVTFAEVVVTFHPVKKTNVVILGFGDYNKSSSNEDINDESDMVRYSALYNEFSVAKDAIDFGEYLAELLSRSFIDAYEYMASNIDN